MSPTEDLHDVVIAAIAETCHVPPESLAPELSLADLALDSLMILSIVTTVENSAQCRLDPDDLLPLFEAATVGELTKELLRLAEAAVPS
jgi:acyl carrier protein